MASVITKAAKILITWVHCCRRGAVRQQEVEVKIRIDCQREICHSVGVMQAPGNSKEPFGVKENCFCLASFLAVAFLAVVLCSPTNAPCAAVVTDFSPTGFFTNVADRLLRSELSQYHLSLTNIPIYPTNRYTPAVHRLLQVTANLYDSTTNRILGLTPEYPYCPSVFRPIFRRVGDPTNGSIVIAGYREVVDASMANPTLAPAMVSLDQPNPPLLLFPPYGVAFSALEKNEPMVAGVPLIIGARKGFPNFNEFSMQTGISVSRFLEFRRAVVSGPVTQTNQMFVVGISNVFGVEAWNSYLTNYPRDLNLIVAVSVTATITNETGVVVLSNTISRGTNSLIAAGTWPGWSLPNSSTASMVLPFGTTNSSPFLPDSTYVDSPPSFVPETHVFSQNTQGSFYVPHWWLNLNTRLLFILVDAQANRIVDYVNLTQWEPTVDIISTLGEGNTSMGNPADYKNPANQWITNRIGNATSAGMPTYGILNQVQVGLNGTTDWQSFAQDPYAGLDAQSAVDGFLYNLLGLGPLYPKDVGKTFYRSNVFYAPFDPYRSIYVHTAWRANDPLVHFLASDLKDASLDLTNIVNFYSFVPPLNNLGQINPLYQPWGGNPIQAHVATDCQVAVKDPGVTRTDDWDFPTNQLPGIDSVGRVHRGTPWQTIFLKSTNILAATGNTLGDYLTWARWTGDNLLITPGWGSPVAIADALFTAPTNDWHLVSTLNALFNTNSPLQLASVNQNDVQSWEELMNGMTVFTNVSRYEIDPLVMPGNSPQAALIAEAILNNKNSQPQQFFQTVDGILSTPELSVASPWLNGTNLLTDQAMEIIPSQLLPLLRQDSVISPFVIPGSLVLQISGNDSYSYQVQVSSNLFDWTSISTNQPSDGSFILTVPQPGGSRQFYRSKLAP